MAQPLRYNCEVYSPTYGMLMDARMTSLAIGNVQLNHARVSILENRHKGQTAVLVCNGPSLLKVDFSLVRNQITVGLNKIYLGFRRFRFYPRYYVAINRLVIEQNSADISRITCAKFIPTHLVSALSSPAPTLFGINTLSPTEHFYRDIAKGVNEGSTVTYAALQICYYLGFSKVVIIGLDHSFQSSGPAHKVDILREDDRNHFDPEYFKNQSWNYPDLKTSEESYRTARAYYEADGRRIIDCTIEGCCNIFEKGDLKSSLLGDKIE